MPFPFIRKHQIEGKALLESGEVKSVIFSEGTYQVEVHDPKLDETLWPFLQVTDEGKLSDSFCTCSEAEAQKSCAHLGAAYLFITCHSPLHVRFRNSFWNRLCLIAFMRHGADIQVFKKGREKEYVCKAQGGETLFSMQIKTEKGKELLDEVVFKRKEETEETSLKFSNLSTEELALWNKRTPTQRLQYELSFWSDLAKWMMLSQEFLVPYKIDYPALKDALPKKVAVSFPDLKMEFYIAEVNWPELIPTLKGVKSPLPVHEFRDIQIEKITYDPQLKEMQITSHHIPIKKEQKEIQVGDWIFVPKKGFFPVKISPLLKQKVMTQKQIGPFLSQNYSIAETYLVGVPIAKEKIEPSYKLSFDRDRRLHISCFIFEDGDLQRKSTTFFGPWVYLQDCGFFLLEEMLFKDIETIILPEEIEDFIKEYRLWLNRQEEFQIHLSSVEFHLMYQFDGETLWFESESQVFEGSDEILDFGGWLYVKGKGFYKKLRARTPMLVSPGKQVARHAISHFIHSHREELEQIKIFFSTTCPIKKAGVDISIDEKRRIVVTPHYFYHPPYQDKQVELIGDFTYVPGEGFAEIPFTARLPEKYNKQTVIEESAEPYFVKVELTKLKSFIIKMDRRLKRPQHLNLKISHIEHDPKTSSKQWVLDLTYESEWGEESLGVIKESLENRLSYAITNAGLIFFKDPRFNWLRELDKKRMSEGGKHVSLSTLEWIRLRTFADVKEPSGSDRGATKTRSFLQQLDAFETDDLFSLEGLESTLRPYQEVGLRWLWFLYIYGLSGLLCDDMGLGKTHQAMALLAAARNAQQGKKARYFVVCPTSVIYHWEELLSEFLPKFRVIVFYGTHRSLTPLRGQADIVLTSYGTMRSEKEALGKIEFEIAIFDEIQIAKNIHSQTHKALTQIRARTKIGLTGTPIENRILELKALFDVVLPNYFPPTAEYRQLFVNPIEKYQDKEKVALLRRLIHPFLLRRKKSEVLEDLPEKIEEIAHCFLSEEQEMLYKQAFLKSRDELIPTIQNPQKNVPYLHVFALLNKLKQVCNHPCLITKDLDRFEKHQSGKWDFFVELVRETRDSGQKLVVFTQYLDMMTIIEKYLSQNQIGYAAIRGSTRDRKKQLETFRDDPQCEVFVASLKAAGTGIDLTAASVVIHYDRWWNPAKENQATDRVHRIGQNRGVQVFKMVTKRTIEEHIHTLIEKKMGLLEGVIGYDDQNQVKHLDRKDLTLLLEQINKDCQ